MKQLLLDSLALGKDLLLLKGPREMYVLLVLNGAAATAVGVVVGSLL
jgi:type IV secretory pathway TrbD component